MTFILRMGVPEMQERWNALVVGRREGTLSADDDAFAEKFGRALMHLRDDPSYPGLRSHEIDALSRRYGRKVFQSYIDNRSEHAWRFYWVYGPGTREITIIGVEPHPEDRKSRGYDRVRLSALPPLGRR